MALDEFVDRKDKIIDVAESTFLKSIPEIQDKLARRLQTWLSTLDIKNGKLDQNQALIDKIADLERVINEELRALGYGREIQDYLSNFDQIDKLNQDLHLDFNDIRVTPAQINPIRNRMVEETVDVMAGNGLNVNLKQPVKDLVRKNIVYGSTLSDTEESLRTLMTGNKNKKTLGKLERYAIQISRDSIQQYDGAVNNQIRETFDMPNITYVGSLITDSRWQCQRWVGMGVIPFSSLTEEIALAEVQGSGMIPGTNPSNFTVFRGGFNCRHEAIPTF